ncbi:MAG TPA: trypsin-like peptidase domain-containing protein [Jatrophihabitans sp.]|jgi:S1-C subfamily serine protease|nr:trypsin-like peptidase domain-containing protein [Jatrophihabitans sp.]
MTTNYPYDPYSAQPPYAAPPQPRPNRLGRVVAGGVAALSAAALVGAFAFAGQGDTVNGSGSMAQLLPTVPGDMNPGRNGRSTSVSLATPEQEKGVVTIVSVLKYQNAESAGTGMILTSNGEILTNNHVIDGATSVTVTVASTDRSYRADVVGTDPTDDVAVLQLRHASGLTTANLGDSSNVQVGDAIVGVGNAGGTGTLRASRGIVSALDRSITATDESGQNAEKLSGLIQVKAAIVSGDSGGPLYDASGDIVGIDTAASSHQAQDSTAYAIPIDSAVNIADQIESGVQTSTIHIGLPAFLGVGLSPNQTRHAEVSSLLPGGPAASAGITSGSVITSVNGTKVTTADSLKQTLQRFEPGQKVSIGWTDASGTSHTATVTLATGPAD